jgi:hypothetical protein
MTVARTARLSEIGAFAREDRGDARILPGADLKDLHSIKPFRQMRKRELQSIRPGLSIPAATVFD